MSQLNQALRQVEGQLQRGEALQAQVSLAQLSKQFPDSAQVWHWLGELALMRGDVQAARVPLATAAGLAPANMPITMAWSETLARCGQLAEARQALVQFLNGSPASQEVWLALAELEDASGDAQAALASAEQAMRRAQARQQWLSRNTTAPTYVEPVMRWVERLNQARHGLVQGIVEAQQRLHGEAAMTRFVACTEHYLGKAPQIGPSDSQQRPKFLYFPGLPDGPYHDPGLHPWLGELLQAYPEIRAEALGLLGSEQFIDFMGFAEGADKSAYVAGSGPRPAWDALFFYRHGQRFDDNHRLAPKTSAVLERIERCEVAGQAPEICFSLLAPGSEIRPHFGVTNTRLVLHLPLLVPRECALNVVGRGEHAWREGEPMMFDDTYEHEAWNRSDQVRVVLLMDCWNPHLSAAERVAVRALVEAISAHERLAPDLLMPPL